MATKNGLHLKKLRDQVMVITGATSGIGLVTSRLAAKRGARLVLAARNEQALQQLSDELNVSGGDTIHVVADVGKENDVAEIGRVAIARFGGFDTWVNNAGVSIYGRLAEISMEDQRRLFDTNFWGVVHGSRTAASHLRQRGGVIINIGSALSDRAMPLQGIYSASKHAVKGYTDALRMELEEEGAPVAVTLVKPAAIDTPYVKHARNYLDVEPKNPPPYYSPDAVADAILFCAGNATRDMFVGGGAVAFSAGERFAPRITDRVMEHTLFRAQRTDRLKDGNGQGILHHPGNDLEERGGYAGHVARTSLYTKASQRPALAGAAIVAAGLAARSIWKNLHR